MNNSNDKMQLSDEEKADADTEAAKKFKESLILRLKKLRQIKYPEKQEQFSLDLGIPLYRYAKYESKNSIPHYLIPKAAKLLGVSPEMLLNGTETAAELDVDLLISCIKAGLAFNESDAWKARYITVRYDLFSDSEQEPDSESNDNAFKMMRHFKS